MMQDLTGRIALLLCIMLVTLPCEVDASGKSDPLYDPATNYFTGDAPLNIASGDLDGDGDLDLVTANIGENTLGSGDVSVLLNNGDGIFVLHQRRDGGESPHSIAIADFDNDSDLDISVANIYANNVAILRNNGGGAFLDPEIYSVGDLPCSIGVGDLDGDGNVDIVVVNEGSDDASVLINLGDGTFALEQRIVTGFHPAGLVVGDLDDDDDLDLAISSSSDGEICILLNSGNAVFSVSARYEVGILPLRVTMSTINEDKMPDLVASNFVSGDISILLNIGNGQFQQEQRISVGSFPLGITINDLDNDDDMDIVVANRSDADLSILLNDGSGVFIAEPRVFIGGSPGDVTNGDFDADGFRDLAVVNRFTDVTSILLNASSKSPPCTWHEDFDDAFDQAWLWLAGQDDNDIIFGFEGQRVENGADDFLELRSAAPGNLGGAVFAAGYIDEVCADASIRATINADASAGDNDQIGVILRGNPAQGSAYLFGIDFATGTLLLADAANIAGDPDILAFAAVPGFNPAVSYVVEFQAEGTSLIGKLFDASGSTLLQTLNATDSAYANGVSGVVVRIERDPISDAPVGTLGGTFDDIWHMPPGAAPDCPGDCDESGSVNFNDLIAMLFAFGPSGASPCDVDESGVVDFNDLVAALFLFGDCPE